MELDIKNYINAICNEFASEYTETPEGTRINTFDYTLTECSGINGLEGILAEQTHADNFIAIDATGDGSILMQPNGGYYIRRVLTLFVVRKYEYGNMADMLAKMVDCRKAMKKILRRMVHDSPVLAKNMLYINTERIALREFAPEISGHMTGLYFMLEFNQPYNLLTD